MTKTAPFHEQANAYDVWFEEHSDLYLAELAVVRSFIPVISPQADYLAPL